MRYLGADQSGLRSSSTADADAAAASAAPARRRGSRKGSAASASGSGWGKSKSGDGDGDGDGDDSGECFVYIFVEWMPGGSVRQLLDSGADVAVRYARVVGKAAPTPYAAHCRSLPQVQQLLHQFGSFPDAVTREYTVQVLGRWVGGSDSERSNRHASRHHPSIIITTTTIIQCRSDATPPVRARVSCHCRERIPTTTAHAGWRRVASFVRRCPEELAEEQ